MTKINKFFCLTSVLTLLGWIGCSSAPKVVRTDVERVVDLSGRWNDTDSRMVAEEMIQDSMGRPWINKFNEVHGDRKPVVIVGTVINRSSEHINAHLFIKDLERELLNCNKVDFVASRQERVDVRDERDDQQLGETEPSTINPKRHETGADFILQGSINSVKDETKGKYVVLYQVNLELIDLTNNQKVWIGQKEIKKIVSKSKYSL